MSKAQEYRAYAAECWRRAWEKPKDRDYWMTVATRWFVLAAMAAKAESKPSSASSHSQGGRGHQDEGT